MKDMIVVTICILVLYSNVGYAQRAEQGTKPVAKAFEAMASSSHPRVTRAILDVLQQGGNAVDAMLTAIPLQRVVEPQMSTLAGGMGGLIYWEDTGELIYLDAELDHTLDAPAAAERYGTRSWKDYFDPAIEAASDGFAMYSFLYGEMYDAFERLGAHYSAGE